VNNINLISGVIKKQLNLFNYGFVNDGIDRRVAFCLSCIAYLFLPCLPIIKNATSIISFSILHLTKTNFEW
jgi:hypothetical protein